VLRLAIATAGPVTLGLRVDGEVLEDLVVRAGRQYLALVLPGRARTGAVVVYLEAPWPRALVLDALTLGP
jgi:hypothetical protein